MVSKQVVKSNKPAAKPMLTKAKTPAKQSKSVAESKPSKPLAAAVSNAFKPSIPVDAPAATVDKLIASIKQRGAKLDVDIHSAACACLFHAAKHGDITLMNRLVTSMPKTVRRNALMVWAMAFGPFMLNDGKDASKPVDTLPLLLERGKPLDMDAAMSKPFWEFRNVREGGSEWLYIDYIGGVMKALARVAADIQNKESGKAKAALDALTAVNEALNVKSSNGVAPTKPEQYTPGVTQDRRGTAAAVH